MRRSNNRRGWRLARPASVAGVAALVLLATACSGGASGSGQGANGQGANGHGANGHGTSQRTSPSGQQVTITPANGTGNADPSAGITVTATTGTLRNVAVHTAG